VDSLHLAQEIERQCAKTGREMDVLVEINSGLEEAKSGVAPDEAAELALAVTEMPHLRLRGFMTMGPKCTSDEEYRKYFSETSRLALDIWTKKLHNIGNPILSMGMSDSFSAAIAEGATMVRVGGRLFVGTEDANE
jgi:pyridoxal phosphate enzyme (YggS family)